MTDKRKGTPEVERLASLRLRFGIVDNEVADDNEGVEGETSQEK